MSKPIQLDLFDPPRGEGAPGGLEQAWKEAGSPQGWWLWWLALDLREQRRLLDGTISPLL